MLLYNVTIGIDREIEAEWIRWMKAVHIPNVMASQIFTDYKFFKVLSAEDSDNPSYCIQYYVPTIEQFNVYLSQYAQPLMEEHRNKFSQQHAAYQTLLEEV